MGRTSQMLLGILAAGLAFSIILAFTGIGVPKEEEAAEEEPITVEQIEAHLQSACVNCHGADLTGAGGPSLHNLGLIYNQDDLAAVIRDGTPNGMPGGLAKGKEQEVAEYLLTLQDE